MKKQYCGKHRTLVPWQLTHCPHAGTMPYVASMTKPLIRPQRPRPRGSRLLASGECRPRPRRHASKSHHWNPQCVQSCGYSNEHLLHQICQGGLHHPLWCGSPNLQRYVTSTTARPAASLVREINNILCELLTTQRPCAWARERGAGHEPRVVRGEAENFCAVLRGRTMLSAGLLVGSREEAEGIVLASTHCNDAIQAQ